MNLRDLAQRLIDGNASLSEWQAEMRSMIRVIHRQATIIAMGGAENVTQSMWGYEGSLVKKQYQFLDNFAADIANNPEAWLNGRLYERMKLYSQAEWSTFEDVLKRQAMMDGNTEERRVLGAADHCTDSARARGCIELAALGWQPIGTLPRIGEATCVTNCHCTFEYR